MKKEWINKVNVQGYLYNFGSGFSGLQEKVSGANAKNPGMKFIQGDINIATDEEATNVVTVHFQWVPEKWPAKNDKPERENQTYQTLKTLLDSAKTYLEIGKEAPKLRIDGDLETNDFYTRDGELASPKRIRGGFIHTATSINNSATFDLDIVIAAVQERTPENEAPYIDLSGYVFDFRHSGYPVTLSVHNQAGIDYFMGADISNSNPLVTRVRGDILSTTIKVEKNEEGAFGSVVSYSTRTFRSWEVTWASQEPYEWDNENVITRQEMKKVIADREAYLAAEKQRIEQYRNSKSTGFGSTGTTFNSNDPYDEDIPF